IRYEDVLEDLGIEPNAPIGAGHPAGAGGPVEPDAGFVLHPPVDTPCNSCGPLRDDRRLTASRVIRDGLACRGGPAQSAMALGYGGWTPGQLEQELAQNSWLTVPASAEIIFDVPFAQRWQTAARALGVDINLLSGQAGHS